MGSVLLNDLCLLVRSDRGKIMLKRMSPAKNKKKAKSVKCHAEVTAVPDQHCCPEAEVIPDKSDEEITRLKEGMMNSLSLSMEEIHALQEKTKDQTESEVWWKARENKIGALQFGRICIMRDTTPRVRTVYDILYRPEMNSRAPMHGRNTENEARQKYSMRRFLGKRLCAVPFCGLRETLLVRFTRWPLCGPRLSGNQVPLDCRTVGIDTSRSCGWPANQQIQLAWKKPMAQTIMNWKKSICTITKQVQGQLHIARRLYCMFIVYTTKRIFIQKIMRDDTIWKEEKLVWFYMDVLLVEIFDRSQYRNQPIREPAYLQKMEKGNTLPLYL